MEKVGYQQSADTEDLFQDSFGEQESPAGYEKHGYTRIHGNGVGKCLKGIELSLFTYGKWRIFLPEISPRVIAQLLHQPFLFPFPLDPVIPSVLADEVPDEKDQVIQRQSNTADVMHFHGYREGDQRSIRVGILHAQACQDKQKEKQGIQ